MNSDLNDVRFDTQQDPSAFGAAAGPSESPDYYAVLNLTPAATRLEVREAYLRMKNTWNAGSAALYSLIDEDEARRQMSVVEEAFRVLGDDIKRQEYDGQRERSLYGAKYLRDRAMTNHDATGSHHDEITSDAERIFLMRQKAAAATNPWSPEGSAADSRPVGDDVVRTNRSTLPIINLRANTAATEDVQARIQHLIAESDPGDGDLYRRLREACGVSEDEMQERIKVSIGYLRAIEGNRFDRLPQTVYVKGFLRSYLKYLAVPDCEKLVQAFATRLVDWQTNRKN